MHKQWEEEPWRLEHADDAKITFTIALHGKHAWELLLEDSRRYHSISHGWATDDPHEWEDVIAPVLRQLFVKGRLGAPRVHGNLHVTQLFTANAEGPGPSRQKESQFASAQQEPEHRRRSPPKQPSMTHADCDGLIEGSLIS